MLRVVIDKNWRADFATFVCERGMACATIALNSDIIGLEYVYIRATPSTVHARDCPYGSGFPLGCVPISPAKEKKYTPDQNQDLGKEQRFP
jgi:hypothetical protein